MIRRAALVAVCALVAGCSRGDGESADEVLSDTAAKLGEIQSGTLHVDLRIEPRGPSGAQAFGFALDGPFSLRSRPLPTANIEYTQTSGDNSATVTLISTGSKAYIEVDGQTYELPPEQAGQLRGAAGQLQAGSGLGKFAIDEWIDDADVDDGGEVGGAETDHVQAELDVVEAVRDLSALARQLGQDVPQLGEQDAERLADSVRSSRLEVYTGKDDRLLRRLELEVDFGLDVPEELRRALGELVGARLVFELGVDDPNEPVRVQAPVNPLPASELPKG